MYQINQSFHEYQDIKNNVITYFKIILISYTNISVFHPSSSY